MLASYNPITFCIRSLGQQQFTDLLKNISLVVFFMTFLSNNLFVIVIVAELTIQLSQQPKQYNLLRLIP